MTDYVTSNEIALLERLTALEFALEQDRDGWIRLEGQDSHQEFTRDALRRITELARLNYIKNPLIRRGVDIARFYVFGRGVNIGATDKNDIQPVVESFLADEFNQAELTSPQARKEREKELRIDGNLFFALFVHPVTGHVRVGTIPFDEISDVVRDPQNRKKIRYYLRQWEYDELNEDTGETVHKTAKRYIRDFRYTPPVDRRSIGKIAVEQEFVIYHVKIGGMADWAFGVSEVYPSLDWAKAYKGFLEDYVSVIKALARFAWLFQ